MPASMLRRHKPATWAPLTLCSLLTATVLAADSNINLTGSRLVATFRQESVAIDASFKNFSGTLVYDAAKPTATHAIMAVDMSSLDIGDEDSDAEVRKPAWFDSAQFPQSSFHSTQFTPGVAGHFDATGILTLKGKARTITVAGTIQESDRYDILDGSFELSRRDFGIGDPSWDKVLDDKVRVRFHLLAEPGTGRLAAPRSLP